MQAVQLFSGVVLVHQPPKISVELHIRYTYVCEQRHEDVVTPPNPPLPKTMASPSLLAHLVTSKFDVGIPLYRLSRQLERSGMDLSPGTAGTWVNRIGGDKIIPLIELLREGISLPELMHMDESHLQVLNSEKAPTATHYMVVRAAGPPGKRIILYDYIRYLILEPACALSGGSANLALNTIAALSLARDSISLCHIVCRLQHGPVECSSLRPQPLFTMDVVIPVLLHQRNRLHASTPPAT